MTTRIFDHLIKAADQATLAADPLLAKYFVATEDGSKVPHPALAFFTRVWQPTKDANGHIVYQTDPETGLPTADPVPAFLPYAYLWAASFDAADPQLCAHPGCVIVSDYDKFLRAEDFIVQSVIPPADMTSYYCTVVRGAEQNYPWG